jgi:hypothetical protein
VGEDFAAEQTDTATGSYPAQTIIERLADLDAERLPSPTADDIGRIRHVFAWHPGSPDRH